MPAQVAVASGIAASARVQGGPSRRNTVTALANFAGKDKKAPPVEDPGEEEEEDDDGAKKKGPKPCNPVIKAISCNLAPDWIHDCNNDSFNMFVGLIISMNALIIGMETDLGEEHFQFFEHFFCIFFLCEMSCKQYQIGCKAYFCDGSNLFDFSLVAMGTFDLYVMSYLVQGSKGGGAVKTLRLLRMLRVMRILRLFKVFHELSVILAAFLKAFSAVMWVSVLTLILDYVCAVFLTQTVGHKAEAWGDDQAKIEVWFGSIGHSMRTLFIIMTLAEWDEIALELQKEIHGLIVFAGMIFYIMVAAFTMVSLITGIISEALIRAQEEDEQHRMDQIEEGKDQFKKDVKEALCKIPGSEDGFLSPKQIDENLDSDVGKRIFNKLATLEVDVDKEGLMDLVRKVAAFGTDKPEDDTQDGVKIDDLVDAMTQLKGDAKASSCWELKLSIQSMQIAQVEMKDMIQKMLD